MGGKGSGGARPGTGPKPKNRHLHLVDGTKSRASGADSPAPTAPVEKFPPPSDLFNEDLITWEALSPLAFEARTLTKATAYAFSLLCRNIVLEKKLAKSSDAGGADHRGLIQRIDAELLNFSLRPNGKALYDAEPAAGGGAPTNPLARFGFGGR